MVHGGGDDGFGTYVGLCPERKIGVVYMTNCDHANDWRVVNRLLSAALGREEEK